MNAVGPLRAFAKAALFPKRISWRTDHVRNCGTTHKVWHQLLLLGMFNTEVPGWMDASGHPEDLALPEDRWRMPHMKMWHKREGRNRATGNSSGCVTLYRKGSWSKFHLHRMLSGIKKCTIRPWHVSVPCYCPKLATDDCSQSQDIKLSRNTDLLLSLNLISKSPK